MPHVDQHPAGALCWIELSTTDQTAAKVFYSAVFGWTPDDQPMGPSEFYTIFKLEGRDVAAGHTMQTPECAAGVPPHWNLYIATDDVEKSTAKAVELGGKNLMGPFDVMDAGRMSVIEDPTGAAFCLWQAKRNKGIGIASQDGALCWADLSTGDRMAAKKFYEQLFGWTMIAGEGKSDDTYLHIQNKGEGIAGILPASYRNPNVPAHWMPYFQTSNIEASTRVAQESGAKIYVPITKIENQLTLSVLADPQGAIFALFEPQRQG